METKIQERCYRCPECDFLINWDESEKEEQQA
jgi:hypothetical protein